MPWTRDEKIFCVIIYLETNSFKTVQAEYRRNFNLAIVPRIAKFIVGYTNFKPEGL